MNNNLELYRLYKKSFIKEFDYCRKERIKMYPLFILNIFLASITILLFLGLLIMIFFILKISFYKWLMIYILNIILLYIFNELLKKNLEQYRIYNSRIDIRLKYNVVYRLIKFVFPDTKYIRGKYILRSKFRSSDLYKFETMKVYYGDDLMSGKIGNTEFEFSELHIVEGLWLFGTESVFHGLFFIADFNKTFNGKTIIILNRIKTRLHYFFKSSFYRKLKKIKLEDPEFNKEFIVYTDSQHQARYILSLNFINKIMNWRKKTGLPISISFSDSNIYIAIHKKRKFFEYPFLIWFNEFAFILDCYTHIKIFSDIIKELDLNTRIWSKK